MIFIFSAEVLNVTSLYSIADADIGSPRYHIKNNSYKTRCAEMDNIDIPFFGSPAPSFRITAKHPTYMPAPINVRAPDFSDCNFSDYTFWSIGRNDGLSAEFGARRQTDRHDFFVADRPPAGKDMSSDMFPIAIGYRAVQKQYIHFTAQEDSDTNIELKIGATLRIVFARLKSLAMLGDIENNPKLTIRVLTWNGKQWKSHGDRTFTNQQLNNVWNIPDLTWIEGTDANIVAIHVVTKQEGGMTTEKTSGYYDFVEMHRRQVRGDTISLPLFDNGLIKIVPVNIDFWWRYPEAMSVEVEGGLSASDVHYIQIFLSAPSDASERHIRGSHLNEFLVIYEDGNVRIVPLKPDSMDISYGASIILGQTKGVPSSLRPVAPIKKIIVRPQSLTLTIYYKDGNVSDLAMWADKNQAVIDVAPREVTTNISPETSFARLRTMWVYDGKADVDRMQNTSGTYPIDSSWKTIDGFWWEFIKTVPTYHNTYSSDFFVEIMDQKNQEPVFLSQNVAVAVNKDADNKVDFEFNLARNYEATAFRLRYADLLNSDRVPARHHQIYAYVDDILVDSTYMAGTGSVAVYRISPELLLGNLKQGIHKLTLVTKPGLQGIKLDRIELMTKPIHKRHVTLITTREAELYDSGTGYIVTNTQASGNKTLRVANAHASLVYRINIAYPIKEAYLSLEYLNKTEFYNISISRNNMPIAKFPTIASDESDGRAVMIATPHMFLGPLDAGEHEFRLYISGNGEGSLDLDRILIFSR